MSARSRGTVRGWPPRRVGLQAAKASVMMTIEMIDLTTVTGGGDVRSDCASDGARLCMDAYMSGGEAAAGKCMIAKKSQIQSPACRAHIK